MIFWWTVMNVTLERTCTHCISWCFLKYEKVIKVLQLQSNQDTTRCFFGGKKHGHSDISFELPVRVSVSRKTLSIVLSVARIMCALHFSLRCSSIPSSLSITFRSPDLSFIKKSIIDSISSYVLLVRTAIFGI